MNKKTAIEIIKKLKAYYPESTCSLDFATPFQMVVAVMLSAQCTDDRVNKTTPSLFEKYPTPQDICNLDISELEQIIHPCGFYRNKAKSIKAMAKEIMEKYMFKCLLENKNYQKTSTVYTNILWIIFI